MVQNSAVSRAVSRAITRLSKRIVMADPVSEWTERATKFISKDRKALDAAFAELDAHLTLRSHVVGYAFTEADNVVWKTIRENHIAFSFIKQGLLLNVTRWFQYVGEINPSPTTASLPARPAKSSKGEEHGDKLDTANFEIGLQDVANGVVTRFPPEPSGYLHIGHAKAAVINDYFAHESYFILFILIRPLMSRRRSIKGRSFFGSMTPIP